MHYVAHLKIEKVERERADRKREIDEVTHLTIKADNLQSLVEKLGKHIEIIEEN